MSKKETKRVAVGVLSWLVFALVLAACSNVPTDDKSSIQEPAPRLDNSAYVNLDVRTWARAIHIESDGIAIPCVVVQTRDGGVSISCDWAVHDLGDA